MTKKPSKNNQQGSGRKPHNSTPPTSPAKRQDIKNQPDANPQANNCKYVKQEPPNVYVNIPPPEKEKWSLANKIALGMGIVTLALTIFTYLLFVKAGVQADQAIRAANSADSVFAETKKEFNLINQPVIELLPDSIKIDKMEVGKPIKIRYLLANLKDVTTKVISGVTIFGIDSVLRNFDSLKRKVIDTLNGPPDNILRYITKESPIHGNATSSLSLTVPNVMYMIQKNHHMYVIMAHKFQDLTTNGFRYSFIVFQISFFSDGHAYSEVLRNEIE